MRLSDRQIQSLKPKDKPYKISDGHNLFIHVDPRGSKYWRYRYRWFGKEQMLALGVYPETSLHEARDMLYQARKLQREGIDPRQERRTRKLRAQEDHTNNFAALATEWLEVRSSEWSHGYCKSIAARLYNDILPEIGRYPLANILPTDILKIARRIEKRNSLEVSRKAIQVCGQVFRYGIVTGKTLTNPAEHLGIALKRRRSQHRAYFKPQELSQFLYQLAGEDTASQAVMATKLMLLTFVRTKELCDATWDEIDLERKQWRIPAQRMKANVPHIVPLSKQAITLLGELRRRNNRWDYVFEGTYRARDPISKNVMRNLLCKLGYKGRATIHGFRATASTHLNESGLFSADAIERQLGHQEANKIRKAYDHSQHMVERTRMMQWWADHLCSIGYRD